MSRRRKAIRRTPSPDPVYNDVEVAKFINRLMQRGKKSVAERIFYDAMEMIAKKIKDDGPLEVFHKAVKSATPLVEVKARRVGGSTYQVPLEVREGRAWTLASSWIIRYASERPGRTMAQKLADELMAAYNGEGATIKKKDDTHKMAEASRAFAHYRF